jgi:outer membrane immunogenic protein
MPYGSLAPETLNMKKIISLLGAVGAVFTVGAAVAADLPSRKAPPPVYAPAPVFSWEGEFFGVSGGYGFGSVGTNATILGFPQVIFPLQRAISRAESARQPILFPGFAVGAQRSHGISGGLVGYQEGYLWHFSNNIVLGYEGDLQWSGVRSSGQNGSFNFLHAQNRLKWFGTERVRLGYAFGRFLPYVTAGVAYGRVTATVTQLIGGAFVGSASSLNAGFAVGAGAEYAFTDHLAAKVDYLYVELQGVHGASPGVAIFPAAPPIPTYGQFSTGRYGVHVVRAGLNLRFDILGKLSGIAGL